MIQFTWVFSYYDWLYQKVCLKILFYFFKVIIMDNVAEINMYVHVYVKHNNKKEIPGIKNIGFPLKTI